MILGLSGQVKLFKQYQYQLNAKTENLLNSYRDNESSWFSNSNASTILELMVNYLQVKRTCFNINYFIKWQLQLGLSYAHKKKYQIIAAFCLDLKKYSNVP